MYLYLGTKFFHWQGWTGLIACALAESACCLNITLWMIYISSIPVTLQLRLYALYYGNKRILALMLCSFIAVMASSAAIMGTALHVTKSEFAVSRLNVCLPYPHGHFFSFTAEANVIPGIPFCIPIKTSNHFYAFWIPILSFETLLCSLALYKGYRSYKDQELKLRLRRRKAQRLGDASTQDVKGATLLEILLRDSVAYFIVWVPLASKKRLSHSSFVKNVCNIFDNHDDMDLTSGRFFFTSAAPNYAFSSYAFSPSRQTSKYRSDSQLPCLALCAIAFS